MLSQSEEDAETHIRRLNPRRDLFTVADLIEQAFKLKGDEEGQAVLRQMRNSLASSNLPLASCSCQMPQTVLCGRKMEKL